MIALVFGALMIAGAVRDRAQAAAHVVGVGSDRGDRVRVFRRRDLRRLCSRRSSIHRRSSPIARVVDPILRLARQNGIDATDVWEIDASKQSKRISANVSGALGTERITLNDNLLNRASLEEIEAVMGHEMGHYVLNHIYKGLMEFGILIVIGFAVVAWLFERLRVRYEGSWKVREHRGPGGASARGAVCSGLLLRGDAGAEHDHAHAGVRGGCVRAEHGAAAGRLRADRDQAERIPEARSGAVGGADLLRSSERAHAHLHGDALEGGEPSWCERGYDTFRVFRFRKSMRMN